MQVSIVNYSEVVKHKDIRIDSEYYHRKHLDKLQKIKECGFKKLKNFIYHMSGGATPLGAEYPNQGVPFLRVQNIFPNSISGMRIKYLSAQQNNQIARSQLKVNDVLLTITGSYGISAVVTEEFLGANINQHSVKITVKNIEPYFLSTFLNSKFGYSQSTRNIVGVTRPALDYSAIENFLIPSFKIAFQKIITSICLKANEVQNVSIRYYQQAQTILLSELGLIDWQPKHQLTFIKNYSDIEQAGRIDAEYYQPKYEEIIEVIKNYSGGFSTIGYEFNQNKNTLNIDNKKMYKYVEIGSVNISSGEIIPNKILGSELPANAKRILNKNDVIVSKVRTYRGAITIIRENGYVGSSAFTVLRESGCINKETLFAFLNLKPLLALSIKPNTGTSYPVIVDDDIISLPIPILSKKKQDQIQKKITESFRLRQQSKALLESAKKAVEIAIEQGEQAAIKWVKKCDLG